MGQCRQHNRLISSPGFELPHTFLIMFYDETRVLLTAGNGGHGCNSLRREKYIPKGGPDGGDGGKGGSVWLVADANVSDLRKFHFQPQWKAGNGEPGRGRQQHGKSGQDCRLIVPVGTAVMDTEGRVVCELLESGEEIRLLKGGEGGKGNIHYKSSTNQTPREFTEGKPGKAGEYTFVLKTVAEIGLVGFPNAGKSTLLRALTSAHPRTGHYAFTTLNPSVGVSEPNEQYRRLTIADIPGLIGGASENRGLGHRFLRHIERCRALLFVLDAEGGEGRKPAKDYEILLQELEKYDPALLQKPKLVAANKIDTKEGKKNAALLKKKLPVPVYPISAELEEGLEELMQALFALATEDVE